MLLLRADVGSRSVVFSALHVASEKKFHSFGFPRSRNFREIALARPISKLSKLNRDVADVYGHILVLFTRLL